jgi:hypothetical protein
MTKITEQQLIERARRLKEHLLREDDVVSAWDKFANHPLTYVAQKLPLVRGENDFTDPNGTEGTIIPASVMKKVFSQFNKAGYVGQGVMKHKGRWYTTDSKDEIDQGDKVTDTLEKIAMIKKAGGDVNAMNNWQKTGIHQQANTSAIDSDDLATQAATAMKPTQTAQNPAPTISGQQAPKPTISNW